MGQQLVLRSQQTGLGSGHELVYCALWIEAAYGHGSISKLTKYCGNSHCQGLEDAFTWSQLGRCDKENCPCTVMRVSKHWTGKSQHLQPAAPTGHHYSRLAFMQNVMSVSIGVNTRRMDTSAVSCCRYFPKHVSVENDSAH